MPTLDELLVKIDASTELLRRELNKGDASVARFERNVDKKLDKVDKRFSKLGAGIRTALGVFGVGVGVAGLTSFTRGVASAGLEMERYERSLKFATGSQQGAEREMDFLRETAQRLGLDLRVLIRGYSNLAAASKGTSIEGQATRDIFMGVSEAAAVLGLTVEQTEGALRAIDQMISKGNVQAEELRGQLGERLPGAFQIAARAMGVTTEELNDLLERGDVAASDLLPKLAKELHRTFGPEVATAANSSQAAINRFNTSVFELKVAIADSGVLDMLAKLATALGAVAGASPFPFERQIEAAADRLEDAQGRLADRQASFAKAFGENLPESKLAPLLADIEAAQKALDALIEKQEIALGNKPAPTAAEAPTAATTRLPITDLPEPTGFGTPVTVRLGGGESSAQPPVSEEEVSRVAEALRQLEEQALRSQGRMAEAIRSAADAQIAEWERVAAETPQFAEQAADAIELINQRAEADIKALKEANPAIQEFASTFAAAFESRGIDALLRGDVSDAVKGLTKDVIELIARLVILRPLAEKLGGIFGGTTGGGSILGSLFGPGFSIEGRASGGPVAANQPYFVHKDEMFVPDVPGRILSAAQMARMGGTSVAVNQEFNVQAGLPPQWNQQTFMAGQIAAAAAKEAVARELGGRR